jgi:hypothetical protein
VRVGGGDGGVDDVEICVAMIIAVLTFIAMLVLMMMLYLAKVVVIITGGVSVDPKHPDQVGLFPATSKVRQPPMLLARRLPHI